MKDYVKIYKKKSFFLMCLIILQRKYTFKCNLKAIVRMVVQIFESILAAASFLGVKKKHFF